MSILKAISDHAKFHPSLLEQFFEMILKGRETGDTLPPICPSDCISSDTIVVESMKSASHTHTTFTFSHIEKIGKVGTKGLVVEEGSFCVRVCVETFLVSRTTGPSWWVRGDRGGVQVRMEEKYDVIHSIAWEIGELCQGIEDVLLVCG